MKQIELSLVAIDKVFILKIVNPSTAPVRIWSTRFSSGYASFCFQVTAENGNQCFIRRKPAIWTVNMPDVVSIQAGQAHIEKFELADGTWDLSQCLFNQQSEIDLCAVLEIFPDENTVLFDVIQGRYESNRLHITSNFINI
ncbi:MAG: hypothetical protein NTV01_01275 [Bacteroidia bacterium]|nr:hypothetical protein [Bacteroidia bacterium]